jgi:hypothetical protein
MYNYFLHNLGGKTQVKKIILEIFTEGRAQGWRSDEHRAATLDHEVHFNHRRC